MVSNNVVMQTVKRMISSGVDDGTIRATLKGINLSNEEIDGILAEAKGPPSKSAEAPRTQAPAAVEAGSGEEEIEGDFGGDDYGDDSEDETPEEMRERLERVSQEQSAQHTTTHDILEEHGEKIGEVHKGVTELHRKLDSSPKISSESIAKIAALDRRMSSLEKEISETKANTVALQDILKKILEANRKTLSELQKKK